MISTPAARGCIFDTNATPPSRRGRFDLIVYSDGVLAIHGNYVRTAMLGASAGAGAGGPGATVGAVAGLGAYDSKRFMAVARCERDELLARHSSNHFLADSDIARLVLRRRWYEHSLQVDSGSSVRAYRWKPRLNRVDYVIDLLKSTFGGLVKVA